MAHMMKHTKASCGHMFAHFDRRAEHISNENVDRTRTHLNYNLATHQTMDQGEFVRKRCAEVHCQNRKDVNVMVSWVVTVPKDLPENEQRAFFEASYDFLKLRYGLENVVSAYVHMDEVTPHMHFAFVPVKHGFKQDKKNPNISAEYSKVSAKEVVNRYDLQSFHESLQRFVEKRLGHEVSILNEATKEGNKSIEELKRQSATERLQEANTEASKIVSKARESVKVVEQDIQALEGKKTALEGKIEALNATVQELEKHIGNLNEFGKEISSVDEWLDIAREIEKTKKLESKSIVLDNLIEKLPEIQPIVQRLMREEHLNQIVRNILKKDRGKARQQSYTLNQNQKPKDRKR